MRSRPDRTGSWVRTVLFAALAGCGDGGSGTPGAGGSAGATAGTGMGGTSGAGGSTGGSSDGTGGSAATADSGVSDDTTGGQSDAPAVGTPMPGGGTWERLAPLPATRQEFGVAEVGGKIFVVGGLNPRADRVESYDPATNSWSSDHPNLPVGLDHPNVAGVAGKLFVFGGTQAAQTLMYDPAAAPADRRWVMKAPMPTRRAAAAVGVLGNQVFVAGGNGSGSMANPAFEIYDAAADTWLSSSRGEVPPLPAGRNHVPGAVVGGRFYVIGGRLGSRFDGLQTRVDVYDPTTKQWSSGAPMPTPRGGCAAGVVDGFIVVVGGEGNMAPGNMGVFPQTEVYDPAANRWIAMKSMMTPRHGMGAAGLGSKLYVPAGGTVDGGGNPVAIVESFSLR